MSYVGSLRRISINIGKRHKRVTIGINHSSFFGVPDLCLHPYYKNLFFSDVFAGREGQTPPFEGRAHAVSALAKNTLLSA